MSQSAIFVLLLERLFALLYLKNKRNATEAIIIETTIMPAAQRSGGFCANLEMFCKTRPDLF